MRYAAMLLLSTIPAFGQSAKVVQLSPDDATTAKSLDAQQKDIQHQIKAFESRVRKKYLVKTTDRNGSCQSLDGEIISGWGCGEFEYSEDFKFIVPATPAPKSSCGPMWMSSPVNASTPN